LAKHVNCVVVATVLLKLVDILGLNLSDKQPQP